MIAGLAILFISLEARAFQSENEAQDTVTAPKDWFLRDPETDHIQGVSAERTYSTLLKGKPSRTILVAVIDSGIDIDHEDLKRMHGNDERVPISSLETGVELIYKTLLDVAAKK